MKLDRSRAASESLPDYNNAVEFPDNNSDFPGSPVSSIELFQDAPTASSLDLSTESVLMGGSFESLHQHERYRNDRHGNSL
ncbi:hypothetical protein RAB80_011676 [Fusarium oxysporum f. sp. vasinfectum]|nr:hypothetical protein RAB80_011676 [Fusarium oxysporum f. sp. vasinfectum]